MRKGTVWPTSRYLTLRAASHNPTDRAATSAIVMNKGSDRIAHLGVMPYQNIMPTKITKAIAKSIMPENAAERGMISLGK
jgi:hypothetical protein